MRWMLWVGLACLLFGEVGQVRAADAVPADYQRVWQQGFEAGLGNTRRYFRETEPKSALEVITGDAPEGQQHLRVTLAGARILEGAVLSVSGIEGNRPMWLRAQVRGRGLMRVGATTLKGWAIAPQVELTDTWQPVTLQWTSPPGRGNSSIYFTSPMLVQPNAVFEIDAVELWQGPPIHFAEVDVPPVALEAEAFALRSEQVMSEPAAGSGQVVRGSRSVALVELPFPRSARPVTVYARVRAGSLADRFRLALAPANDTAVLVEVQPAALNQWAWIRFEARPGSAMGEVITLEAIAGSAEPVAIDRLIYATDATLGDAALDQVLSAPQEGPLATVTRLPTAPVIDGDSADPAWQEAVVIRDFLAYQALTPAASDTQVRLGYDAGHLYLLLICDEPLLAAVAHTEDRVIAAADQRDGEVLRDDSVIVLLQPQVEGPVYEFSVNTLGTLLDARMAAEDLWGTRDLTWDSAVDLAVRRGDGVWTVEMAIPVADLGLSAIEPGTTWRASLVRNARSRSDHSAWNPLPSGAAHAPGEWGLLHFSDQALAVQPEAPMRRLDPGSNVWRVPLKDRSSQQAGVYVTSDVRSAEGSAQHRTFVPVIAGQTQAEHPFPVVASGMAAARWGVVRADTLQPVYLAPRARMAVQRSAAAMELTTGSAYQVFVNDVLVHGGASAAGERLTIPLRQGENVVAVRAASGSAVLRTHDVAPQAPPERWKRQAASTPDATLAAIDDGAWPAVLFDAGEPAPDPAGDAAVYRRTILYEKTRVWPVPGPAIYLAGNSAQQITFTLEGVPGKSLADWTTYVAVPAGLEILGASGYYAQYESHLPFFDCQVAGTVTLDGQPMTLYRIRADKPVVAGKHPVRSVFEVLMRISDPQMAREGVSWPVTYWSEAHQGAVIEWPQMFEVRALPPLRGRQPQVLNWELWGSFFHAVDDKAMRLEQMAMFQQAGFTRLVSSDRWTSEVIDPFGMQMVMPVTFESWSIGLGAHLRAHPSERLIDAAGEPVPGAMCTTLLIGDRWPVAAAILTRLIEDRRPSVVLYDYEFSTLTGPHVCYCSRCTDAFKMRAGLPAEHALSPTLIAEQHRATWTDFMAWRAAELFVRMRQTTHATGRQFDLWCNYQEPETMERWGVDFHYVGQLQGVDTLGLGYGRRIDSVRMTYDALPDTPVMLGVLTAPYNWLEMLPHRPATQAELLRRSIDATGGVLVFDRKSMDGRSWFAVAETTRLVAEYESVFLARQIETPPGQDEAAVQLLRGEGIALLCLMNEGRMPRTFEVKLPAALGAARAFYSGEQVAAGSTLRLTLPEGETAVYVFER